MVVLAALSVVPDHPNSTGEIFIVCSHGAGFTAGAEIFSGIETESSSFPHRTRALPCIVPGRKILAAMSLAGILENHQAVLLRECHDGVHVAHLAIEMNRHD